MVLHFNMKISKFAIMSFEKERLKPIVILSLFFTLLFCKWALCWVMQSVNYT